jgi:hypothetical protein
VKTPGREPLESTPPGKSIREKIFTTPRWLWLLTTAVLLCQVLLFTSWYYGRFDLPVLGNVHWLASKFFLYLAGALAVRCLVERRFPSFPQLRDGVPAIALLIILATFYGWTKVMIPHINPALWDELLAGMDRRLCAGVDPNVFLLTIFANTPEWIAWSLDWYYGFFTRSLLIFSAWFLTDRKSALRAGFLFGLVFLWVGGLGLYVLVPAHGPVYHTSGLLQEVYQTFPGAAGVQKLLLENYIAVQSIGEEGAVIQEHFGIAAMPSLHVGLHAFLWFWAMGTRSRLRYLLAAMTILTFFGSVATGWHYIVDGLAGLGLAGLSFWMVRPKLEKPEPVKEVQ